jgi:LacI family transcriptional regulator
VTRDDVARQAGVSTAVVSYVVNNGPKPVAPKTAARVRDAIALDPARPTPYVQFPGTLVVRRSCGCPAR